MSHIAGKATGRLAERIGMGDRRPRALSSSPKLPRSQDHLWRELDKKEYFGFPIRV